MQDLFSKVYPNHELLMSTLCRWAGYGFTPPSSIMSLNHSRFTMATNMIPPCIVSMIHPPFHGTGEYNIVKETLPIRPNCSTCQNLLLLQLYEVEVVHVEVVVLIFN